MMSVHANARMWAADGARRCSVRQWWSAPAPHRRRRRRSFAAVAAATADHVTANHQQQRSLCPPLLTNFDSNFEAELETISELQQSARLAPAGPPLLDALGRLDAAAAALARPAAYFGDFHPDPAQAAAAGAVLEVARYAAAEVFGDAGVVTRLLATAAAALGEDNTLAAGWQLNGDSSGQEGGGLVEKLSQATRAIDNVLYAQSPDAGADDDAAGAPAPRGRLVLLLAIKLALRSSAAALAFLAGGGGGGGGGAADEAAAGATAHPYEEVGSSFGGDGVGGMAQRPQATARAGSPQAAVEMAAAALARVSHDPRVSPILLLTDEQAAVVAPLLRDAQVPAEEAWLQLPGGGASGSGGNGGADAGASLRLKCSRRLRAAPGPGGALELTGLVSATEAAEVWLRRHGGKVDSDTAAAAAEAVPQRGWLVVPAGAPLRALRLTRDLLSLLLQAHPNADVRRQVHASGLEPRRRHLLAAAGALARARAQLAAARGAPSYLDLLAADGSPLRCGGGAAALLESLADGVAPYARAALPELSELAASAAVAGGGKGSALRRRRASTPTAEPLAPWDADFALQAAAVDVAAGATWREFGDYFTLPALWGGLDRALAHLVGLRLLPAAADDDAASGGGGGAGGGDSGLPWGPGVWRLQLWDESPPADIAATVGLSSDGSNGPRSRQPLLLGDVYIEVAPPGGFPFTTLVRAPSVSRPLASSSGGALPSSQASTAAGSSSDTGARRPGAVVIRLPLSLSVARTDALAAGGAAAEAEPAPPERPPALAGPFGLRALLHEMGHAAALLAAGAAAPHSLLGGGGCLAGGGGGTAAAAAVDLRELPSHVFEAWARDPYALSLLSCHWRLGAPLPPRDAARLAAYAFSAGQSSALDLHDAALAALADARLHSLPASHFDSAAAVGADDTGGQHVAANTNTAAAAADAALATFDRVWAERGLFAGGGFGLEALRAAEALGAVGGAKWGYVMARLLAAAARKRWLDEGGGGRGDYSGGGKGGGWELKRRLLYGLGEGLPPQAFVGRLLGPGALARLDVAGSGSEPCSCWVPDLGHSAFQDIDLL